MCFPLVDSKIRVVKYRLGPCRLEQITDFGSLEVGRHAQAGSAAIQNGRGGCAGPGSENCVNYEQGLF